MHQHLWMSGPKFRTCEVCRVIQTRPASAWTPAAGPICPGEDGDHRRHRHRPIPKPPAGSPRELEYA